MSTAIETIKYKDYSVKIYHDEDAGNPFKYDTAPTLVLHTRAENKFGWTNHEDWGHELNGALERLNERYPLRQCLAVMNRWLRVFHGVPVVLPVGAGDHSGWWAYLGDGADFADPGGWDSGWVGWLFLTSEQIEDWYGDSATDDQIAEGLATSFLEFDAWVRGECYGYVITDPDGEELDDGSCWGFYRSECYEPGGYLYQQAIAIINSEVLSRHESKVALFRKLVSR